MNTKEVYLPNHRHNTINEVFLYEEKNSE